LNEIKNSGRPLPVPFFEAVFNNLSILGLSELCSSISIILKNVK